MEPSWVGLPSLFDAQTCLRISSGDRQFTERLFAVELLRVRRFYVAFGDPRMAYLAGRDLAEIGVTFPASSTVIALYESMLAEYLIATGSSPAILLDAEAHLVRAQSHAERAPASDETRVRALSKVMLLRAVVEKALGRHDASLRLIHDHRSTVWWRDHSSTPTSIALDRQWVMMTGDLEEHMALLAAARSYAEDRPLEYFRTVKRVLEFTTNLGLVESSAELKGEAIRAFSEVASISAPISRLSFLKNLAQAEGLEGNVQVARDYADAAMVSARSLGLSGQLRQLTDIREGLNAGEVRGALHTFKAG